MDKTKEREKALLAKRRLLEKGLAANSKELAAVGLVKAGDKPSPEQVKLFKQGFSFTVEFVRRKALRKVRSPGGVCKSTRRFSSRKEALHHAGRFSRLHRHKSFEIKRVGKNPNAWVNWTSGKTNPVISR